MIKVKELKVVLNNKEILSVQDGEFEGDITVDDFKEMVNVELAKSKTTAPPIRPVPKRAYYPGTLVCITNGDIVVIRESEFCVTNTDTIKYDEKVSGKIASVLKVYELENKIEVQLGLSADDLSKLKVFVHAHWLEFKSR